ncbi:MAG: hypothetical protein ACPGUV_08170 [Polyangiales bacterium]
MAWPKTLNAALAACLMAAALSACGSDSEDARGTYTLFVTSGSNDCRFADWTSSSTVTDVVLNLVQSGNDIEATVEGSFRREIDDFVGGFVFEGSIDGRRIEATLLGRRPYQLSSCLYSINVELSAELDEDLLGGEMLYRPATNGNPTCGELSACVNRQRFTGARPPQ